MLFEQAYEVFLQTHIRHRKGERRGRLERGHMHAEKLFLQKVWWPLHGNFDDLHPEYEIKDWRERSYFADFAHFSPSQKIIIEIKGFGPHVVDMDRQKYCAELNRELFLQAIGFRVLSFSYDDIVTRADQCIFLLRMVLNRYTTLEKSNHTLTMMDRETILLALARSSPLRPIDIVRQFNINHRTAVKVLRSLVERGYFHQIESGTGQRTRFYQFVYNTCEFI